MFKSLLTPEASSGESGNRINDTTVLSVISRHELILEKPKKKMNANLALKIKEEKMKLDLLRKAASQSTLANLLSLRQRVSFISLFKSFDT